MKNKAIMRTILAIILLAAVGVTVFFVSRPKGMAAVKAVTGDFKGSINETGTVRGEDEVTYFAGVSAPVKSFKLREGDRVDKGEELLVYDLTDLGHEALSASLAREQSEAAYLGAVEKSDRNEKIYNEAKENDALYASVYALVRENTQSLDEQQYAEDYYTQCARQGVEKKIAKKNEEILDKNQELDKVLYKISEYKEAEKPVPDKTDKKRKNLRDDVNDLNDELLDLQTEEASTYTNGYTPGEYAAVNDNSNALEDLARGWEEVKTEKQNYESSFLNENEKATLERQAQSARENESYAAGELEKASAGIASDLDGVVTWCGDYENAYVAKGTKLFTLESADELKVEVGISRFDIGKIHEQDEAVITTADGKTHAGHVERISHLAKNDDSDKSRITVDVAIDDIDEGVVIGADADVSIITSEIKNCVMIPAEAYYADDDGSYCYVIENGRLEKRYFECGEKNEAYVACLSGIDATDTVVVDAVTDSMVGVKVRAFLN